MFSIPRSHVVRLSSQLSSVRSTISHWKSFSASSTVFNSAVEEVPPAKDTIQAPPAPATPSVSGKQDVTHIPRLEKSINICEIVGRIGNEPALRGTEKHPVLLFSVATNSPYRDETGNTQNRTHWHRVSIFRSGLREACFKNCRKGTRVWLSGEIQYATLKDPQNDYVRTVTNIVADDVIVLAPGRGG